MVNSKHKYIPEKHGRAAHYYRKVALQRYSEQPADGLGLHSPPRINLKGKRRPGRGVHPAVWAIVLLTIAVFFFVCVMGTLALGRLIF